MAKIKRETGSRVIVEIDAGYATDQIKAQKTYAKDLVEQIKRHCDQWHSVYIDTEYEAVCGHCGYAWGEESDIYNGGCCAKDEENNPDKEKVA